MQRLLEDFLRGDPAFRGDVEYGQPDRGEHGLLHDQDRCHECGVAENVGGDRQADVIRVEIQRVQCADGRIRRLHVEEQTVENQEDGSDEHGREERDDDGGVEDLEDLLLRQNREHQAWAGHEEAEAVEHHLRGRPADTQPCGRITGADHDADDAEAFHRA